MEELTFVISDDSSAFDEYIHSTDPPASQEAKYHELQSRAVGIAPIGASSIVGQTFMGPTGASSDEFTWTIYRNFLIFNTASLPDTAIIASAKIRFYSGWKNTNNEFDVVVQNGQPTYPHIPLQGLDYNKVNYDPTDGGSINTADITAGAFNELPLNEDGLTWINKSGLTKIAIRSSRDIDDLPPAVASDEFQLVREYISFSMTGVSTAYKARLIVEYNVETKPVVTTQAATEIGYQAAMGNGTIVSSTNATERGFEVKLSFSSTLNDYIQHRIAGFLGDVTFSSATNWSGTLTKTETDTGDFAEGAYELVLGYPSVLGNPSSVFSDKLFKCESYTYRAYAIISDVTYYGDYVAFDTLCDDGNNPGDDISEGDPTVPIIPIEPEPEIPPFEWEPEEDEPYPPWDWTPPEWNQPDYPGLDWTIDFYYRKPYTKKDLDELRKKCIIYNKNSIEFALVLRHNMNVLKEFFNMMTDYMSAEEYNDFTDLIPPQRLKELYLDPLNPVDFRDMINGFIRNTVDNNIAVNRNFKLIQDGLSDYETETDDAYFREITTSIKPLQQDNPDVERMKGLINNLNYEVASNFNEIMRNLEILRAKLL